MRPSMIGYGVLSALVCSAMMGCMMTGSYHSAKTLEPGTSRIGLTFGINEIQTKTGNVTLPNLIPELTFHTGITENMEVGGRVALGSLGLEGDFKYRFLKRAALHLAVDPAIGYQGLVFMKGITFSLPVISTVDLSKSFSLNTALFGRYAHFSSSDSTISDAVKNIVGDAVMAGVAFGPDIKGESFYIRPMVEFARIFPAGGAQWSAWNRLSIAVHLGWVLGREKQQLDRIEKKLDESQNKKDK